MTRNLLETTRLSNDSPILGSISVHDAILMIDVRQTNRTPIASVTSQILFGDSPHLGSTTTSC